LDIVYFKLFFLLHINFLSTIVISKKTTMDTVQNLPRYAFGEKIDYITHVDKNVDEDIHQVDVAEVIETFSSRTLDQQPSDHDFAYQHRYAVDLPMNDCTFSIFIIIMTIFYGGFECLYIYSMNPDVYDILVFYILACELFVIGWAIFLCIMIGSTKVQLTVITTFFQGLTSVNYFFIIAQYPPIPSDNYDLDVAIIYLACAIIHFSVFALLIPKQIFNITRFIFKPCCKLVATVQIQPQLQHIQEIQQMQQTQYQTQVEPYINNTIESTKEISFDYSNNNSTETQLFHEIYEMSRNQ
jgi:hypothetical protein